MTHLILSPHYDDAVYSCGARIYELVQAGAAVTMMTIMAGIPTPPLPDTPVIRDNHARWQEGANPMIQRRQEDHTAAAYLGATVRHLDLLDCLYRTHDGDTLYPDEASLWRTIHPHDTSLRALERLTLPSATIIYAPLGVGAHVDHLIVRDWAINLAQKSDFTVNFYVEYPYSRSQAAIQRAYDAFPHRLQSHLYGFSEATMHHKIAAMRAYASQVSSFWQTTDAMTAEIKQTFATAHQRVMDQHIDQPYAEHYATIVAG